MPYANIGFLQEAFDAVPAMLLVVDEDVRIMMLNAQASNGLGLRLGDVRDRRAGDVLHCLHAVSTPEGCGRADFCQDCVIRNSIILAMHGTETFRRGISMTLQGAGGLSDVHLLVSVRPFHWSGKQWANLMLENVSDLIQLRNLLPICMYCHGIRDTG